MPGIAKLIQLNVLQHFKPSFTLYFSFLFHLHQPTMPYMYVDVHTTALVEAAM